MPRILDLLDRYGIKTCIFHPGLDLEFVTPPAARTSSARHEVGHHGYLHEKPFFMKSREEEESLRSRASTFQEGAGGEAARLAHPVGGPEPTTMEMLAEHDFVYHTTRSTPPICPTPRDQARAAVEFPTASCNNDAPFFMWSPVPPVGNGSGTAGRVGCWSEDRGLSPSGSSTGSRTRKSSSAGLADADGRPAHPAHPGQGQYAISAAATSEFTRRNAGSISPTGVPRPR